MIQNIPVPNEVNIKKEESVPINLPQEGYKPPMILSSKLAKQKVATHLNFLEKLTNTYGNT